jgi:hypothetical protein
MRDGKEHVLSLYVRSHGLQISPVLLWTLIPLIPFWICF